MADSWFGDSVWAFVVIGGFIILGAAIAWAKMKNRVSNRQNDRTEDATRQLYRDTSAEDRSRTP